MSVSYFTKIVYGVRLENDEINVLNQKDDEFCDKNCDFIHRANYYDNDEDIVIGIQVGDDLSLIHISEPTRH